MERLLRGDPLPVEPEDEAAWDAEVLAAGRAMIWDDAVLHLAQNRRRAVAALRAFDDPPDEAAQWFEDDTLDHYEEHAAQIRAFVDRARSPG
jgi:hypothetical protein